MAIYKLVIPLYLLIIVIANVLTAGLEPFNLGVFIIPAGTFFVGLTFILRDLVQVHYGKKTAYFSIFGALNLSGITSFLLGDSLWIVAGSMISFLISESTDTEIYSRVNAPFYMRVLYSGIFGGMMDSIVFVVIALSPIGAGFIGWEHIPLAIIGQFLWKTITQAIVVVCLRGLRFEG